MEGAWSVLIVIIVVQCKQLKSLPDAPKSLGRREDRQPRHDAAAVMIGEDMPCNPVQRLANE
jgi:hypothetical protein